MRQLAVGHAWRRAATFLVTVLYLLVLVRRMSGPWRTSYALPPGGERTGNQGGVSRTVVVGARSVKAARSRVL